MKKHNKWGYPYHKYNTEMFTTWWINELNEHLSMACGLLAVYYLITL